MSSNDTVSSAGTAHADLLKDPLATANVRILSLNCWGLKYVSKLRAQRLRGIADQLAISPQYDIVALQELWVDDDFDLIRTAVAPNLPHYKRFYSGILAGPGLTVFSKWPIIEAWLHPFAINGRPSAFFRGDWYVGKSVCGVIIQHPSGAKLELLNSHMHAPYGTGDAAYVCHRAAQAWMISQLARRAISCGHVTFAVGDFNSSPGSMNYEMFQKLGHLADTWVEKHGEYTGNIAELSPEEQISRAGVTSDSQLNTWRQHYPLEKATRLDYIFFDPASASVSDAQVTFTQTKSGVSLSDHFGIEGSFEISPRKKSGSVRPIVSRTGLVQLYDEILVTIAQYIPTSENQASLRLGHFVVSVVLTIGLLIGIWFAAAENRTYVGFIFILVAIVLMVTGVTNGLIGLLFGRQERRALREFEDEVWAARRLVSE